MELTDEMKKKAQMAFMDSMQLSGGGLLVSAHILKLDKALDAALQAAVAELAEPDLFQIGDKVEVIEDVEDVDEVEKGMTGTVLFFRRSQSGEDTDTQVQITGIPGYRSDFWFYGEKELKKL